MKNYLAFKVPVLQHLSKATWWKTELIQVMMYTEMDCKVLWATGGRKVVHSKLTLASVLCKENIILYFTFSLLIILFTLICDCLLVQDYCKAVLQGES